MMLLAIWHAVWIIETTSGQHGRCYTAGIPIWCGHRCTRHTLVCDRVSPVVDSQYIYMLCRENHLAVVVPVVEEIGLESVDANFLVHSVGCCPTRNLAFPCFCDFSQVHCCTTSELLTVLNFVYCFAFVQHVWQT